MDAIIEKILNEDKIQKQQEIEDKITNAIGHPTKIYALGGIEEIGKNMYVFEQNDELFIVDCGIKFASEELLGIDAIVCPFDVLVENKEKIKGLIITHGHEDHIGGIPYLLMTVNIPVIYGSKLALEMIKKKLREFDIPKMPTFTTIDDDT
ncbi:MAG: MBL fold metallo-hydrolase [Acholeplasmatales bacterium]|nr:MBL fold metallo-hydrolase [Acholeplasmatales bacterium]